MMMSRGASIGFFQCGGQDVGGVESWLVYRIGFV
jgi:hypothetical protein